MRTGRCIVILVLSTFACREDFETSYRTYHDALADGAITRGWLPAWLPPTATDIVEWHDLDTNATFASFDYGSAPTTTFLSTCEPTSRTPLPSQPRSASWPRDRSDLQFYSCAEKTRFADGRVEVREAWVAIDRKRTRAYFWR